MTVAALRISESIARDPAQSADVGEASLVLGSVQESKGDRAAARKQLTRAAESLANGLGRDHPLVRDAAVLEAALRD